MENRPTDAKRSAGCPTASELEHFALGDLPGDALERIAEHVPFCEACEQRLGEFSTLHDRVVSSLRAPPPRPEFDAAEMEQLVQRVELVLRPKSSSDRAPAGGSSAAALSQVEVDIEVLVSRLLDSRLVEAGELSAARAQLPASGNPAQAEQLLADLVQAGKLTAYQADALRRQRGHPLVLGEYVVLDRLGGGGMGEVYKARHRRMDRLVAIKLIRAAIADSAQVVDRFQREVRAVARLKHPNIVTAFDAGELDGIPYLVTELVDGEDLSSLVKRNGPFPLDAAVDYIRQAAHALSYAHRKGVVHRDIKPSNMLLDVDGTIKILDLGLARINDSAEGLTVTEQVMGSVDYMSPEQAIDTRNADARSDIYSLGCTLWCLITGSRIYQGDTPMLRILRHREAPIPSLGSARSDVPAALDTIFRTMVAKLPADRYQTMDALLAELDEHWPWSCSTGSRTTGSSHSGKRTVSSMMGQRRPSAAVNPQTIEQVTSTFVCPDVDTDPNSELSLSHTRGSGPRLTQGNRQLRRPRSLLVGALFVTVITGAFALWQSEKRAISTQDSTAGKVDKPIEVGRAADKASEPPAASVAVDCPDCGAAKWVLEHGGTVQVVTDEGQRSIAAAGALPPGEFKLVDISLRPQIGAAPISDADLEKLVGLTQLSRLDLCGAAISDDATKAIGQIKSLRKLNLSDTAITDAGLSQLSNLAQLQVLHLQDTHIEGAGLAYLKACPMLQDLTLMGCTRLRKPEFKLLADFRNLHYLVLSNTAFDDDDARWLQPLGHLRVLRANQTRIGDRALESIATLKALELLALDDTRVTSAGISRLSALKGLRGLSILHTAVSAETLRGLQSQLPACVIGWSSANLQPATE